MFALSKNDVKLITSDGSGWQRLMRGSGWRPMATVRGVAASGQGRLCC